MLIERKYSLAKSLSIFSSSGDYEQAHNYLFRYTADNRTSFNKD